MGVLADHQIRKRCRPQQVMSNEMDGSLVSLPPMLDPFNDSQVEPASYDVLLGHDFLVFERDDTPVIDTHNVVDITKPVTVSQGGYFLMHPGEFALGRTLEAVNIPNDLVARIEGKSTIGRLGLMIHITAGYIDPGFRGPITLELYCVHPLPVMIYPGDRIAQLSFHEMSSSPSRPYQGRYQDAQTVEASKARSDFNIERHGPARIDPSDGNAYVLERPILPGSMNAYITDIMGGHARAISVSQWFRWEFA